MPNIEPIVGAAIKGARKIAGIVGAGAKDVHPTYKTGALSTPKSGVSVKPAAKQIGNPPNNTKAWESVLSSASRGGIGSTMGKLKDARVAQSKTIKIGGGTLGPLKKQIADAKPLSKAETKANARGLKAANKPVSKNNRNVGGPVLTAILKRSEPARPNRTRLGNTTKKK